MLEEVEASGAATNKKKESQTDFLPGDFARRVNRIFVGVPGETNPCQTNEQTG